MFQSSKNILFSTPKYLEMPSFGIDISDDSIKYAELLPTDRGLKIGRFGHKKLPAGTVELGKIKDPEKFETVLASIKKEEGINSVRVSILENQIYLFRLKLPKAGLTSIHDSIAFSLEEHIPIPAQEAIFDYDIFNETDTDLELEVGAIQASTIEQYLSVFRTVGIDVYSFELEAQAIARSIIKTGDVETYMIVDFGEKRTGIFIVSRGIVLFTSTIDVGGMVLNSMIQKHFKVTYEEANTMKQKFGLQRNTVNRELFSVLLNSVSILRDEIAKHFLFWHTYENEDGTHNPPIKKIILCGGDSNLIGLTEYLSVSMKTQVELANVWVNILKTGDFVPDIDFRHSLSFAAALGLALGDFNND